MIDQDKRDRERESKNAIDSLDRTEEEILKEIFFSSSAPLSLNSTTAVSRTIAHFSSLLIKLSRQAEKSTEVTIKLTKQLLYLTWFIAILTAVILFVSIFDFPQKPIIPDLNPANKTEQSSPNKTLKNKENSHK